MDHDLELTIPILEILEIGLFWFSGILEILEIGFFYFLISWKYGRRAGGSMGCVVLPWIVFGTCFLEFPDILEILEICFFSNLVVFFQKRRAPKFHAGCTDG